MGKPIANPYGDKKCPQCGKNFYVNWTDQWVYKRFVDKAERCFCSWKCVREFDKKGEEKQVGKLGKKRLISQEHEAQAVDIALDGGDPIQFLIDHGSQDPYHMWYRIRARLKVEDPESYAKLPKRMPRKNPVKVETPEASVAEPETPEHPKIYKAMAYDGMTVREVEGAYARYRRSDIHGEIYIDVEFNDAMDILSYTIEQWRAFRKEQDRAAMILGVEL